MAMKTTRYRCNNPECSWAGQVRLVQWEVMGVGLVRQPAGIYCDCDDAVEAERLPDLEP